VKINSTADSNIGLSSTSTVKIATKVEILSASIVNVRSPGMKAKFIKKGVYDITLRDKDNKCTYYKEEIVVHGKGSCSCTTNLDKYSFNNNTSGELLSCINGLENNLEIIKDSGGGNAEECMQKLKEYEQECMQDNGQSQEECEQELTEYKQTLRACHLMQGNEQDQEKCEQKLSRLEGKKRAREAWLINAIANNNTNLNDKKLDENIKIELLKLTDFQEEELALLQKKPMPRKSQLYVPYVEYEDYTIKFNIGYEAVGINEMFEQGLPRYGLAGHFKLGGSRITEGLHGLHPLTYGSYLSFSGQVTNSGEQDTTDTSQTQTVKRAFDAQALFFWPWHRSIEKDYSTLRGYVGPVFSAGFRNADTANRSDARWYGGLRLSANPEMYADFLFGKTESLDEYRVETAIQFPVMLIKENSRLYIGMNGNFATDRKNNNEGDAFRFYSYINTDLKGILRFIEGDTSEYDQAVGP
jgi:hypothetical protein